MRPDATGFLIALTGALVGLAMALMKFLPMVPGHFSGWEWLAFGLWIILGTWIGHPFRKQTAAAKNSENTELNS
jgi:hypothetical protein